MLDMGILIPVLSGGGCCGDHKVCGRSTAETRAWIFLPDFQDMLRPRGSRVDNILESIWQ